MPVFFGAAVATALLLPKLVGALANQLLEIISHENPPPGSRQTRPARIHKIRRMREDLNPFPIPVNHWKPEKPDGCRPVRTGSSRDRSELQLKFRPTTSLEAWLF
jgi:hypothetical protein